MQIFINGFGRIGRTLMRQLMTDAHKDIEIVGINDIAALDMCAYLLRYDSVFGPFPQSVEMAEGAIVIAGRRIPFTSDRDISRLNLSGVDVVLECAGTAQTRDVAERGLRAGAKAVLISGPSAAADKTVVLGANEQILGDAKIVSNASCTTNAIAPLLQVLEGHWGVARAHITTIHCYTGSQPTVDAPAASFARSRAAGVSMVPTSTSAAQQIFGVLPAFSDRLSIAAVRVPVISVSAVDAVVQLKTPLADPVETTARAIAERSDVIGVTDDPVVSTDMRGRPESLILAALESQIVGANQIRLYGWYDNEWGFSARMIDMARLMTKRK